MELLHDHLAANICMAILASTGIRQVANRRAAFTGTATETHLLQLTLLPEDPKGLDTPCRHNW